MISHAEQQPLGWARRSLHTLAPFLRFEPFTVRRAYAKTRNAINESDEWDAKQWRAYQLSRIQDLIAHASSATPYYRALFKTLAYKPGDIRTLDDIRELPFLTKDVLADAHESLRAENYADKQLSYVTTGGSTGHPVGFLESSLEREAVEPAYLDAIWHRLGYRRTHTSAVLRGDVLPAGRDGFHWRYAPRHRRLLLSSYNLSEESAQHYLQLMHRHGVRHLFAYPSAAALMTSLLPPGNRDAFLANVFCASEPLYEWQRTQIAGVLGCRVSAHYGMTERVLLAGECEASADYHFFPQYGYAELIDSDGTAIEEEGIPGEIVGTSFTNWATPMIRYRTGDVGMWVTKSCSCGRRYPLMKQISGRLQEFMVTSSGRYISMTAINMHSSVFDHVKQFQFHQQQRGNVTLNIVPRPGYGEEDARRIRTALAEKLGEDVALTIATVDSIPLTPRGKHRFLIQDLALNIGDA